MKIPTQIAAEVSHMVEFQAENLVKFAYDPCGDVPGCK